MNKTNSEAYILCSGEDRDEWLRLRDTGITASDVPAVCGRSSFKKPHDVVMEKVFGAPTIDNEHMVRGRVSEDYIFTKLCRDKGSFVRNKALYANKDILHLYATPDFIGPDAIIEVKSPYYFPHSVPDSYIYQLQAQMLVLGVHTGYIYVGSIESGKYEATKYHTDQKIQKEILDSVAAIWDKIERWRQLYA